MAGELNFNQAMAQLAKAKVTPAAQPASSNAAPADAWRKVVDAQAKNERGGMAQAEPFHRNGTVSAHDAWMRAIAKPKA